MSWLNPVAFLGLFALAVPILVHLFGRRVAKRQRFPSLRLLRDARPTPATRSRPGDVLLLILRCLTIAAAVAALAQPRWSESATRAPVRTILIDSSASMQRLTSEGTPAVQQARAIAQQMADSSSEALIVERDRPGRYLAGAGSWLSGRGAIREVVVISDFQAGSITEGDLAVLPSRIGTRLVRVNATGPIASADTLGGVVIEASPDRSTARWTTPGADSMMTLTVLAAGDERDGVRASVAAARAVNATTASSAHRVTVVFPYAPARRELLAQASPVDSAWQGDLMLALERDPVLASVARAATVVPSCETGGVIVTRNVMGEAIASVARGPGGLLVLACVSPGSLAATALLASIEAAMGTPAPMLELEPNFLPDETLRRWELPAIESAPHGPGATSPDGRWIWLVALAFLVAEEIVRRRSPRRETPRVNEVPNERVA